MSYVDARADAKFVADRRAIWTAVLVALCYVNGGRRLAVAQELEYQDESSELDIDAERSFYNKKGMCQPYHC